MSFVDSIKLTRNNANYDILCEREYGVKNVNSLSNLPTDKAVVVANISGNQILSISDSMKVGEEVDVICIPSAATDVRFSSNCVVNGNVRCVKGVTSNFSLNIVKMSASAFLVSIDAKETNLSKN